MGLYMNMRRLTFFEYSANGLQFEIYTGENNN
jgi:hypothetical protein